MYLQPHAKVYGKRTYMPLPPSVGMKNEGGAGHVGEVNIDSAGIRQHLSGEANSNKMRQWSGLRGRDIDKQERRLRPPGRPSSERGIWGARFPKTGSRIWRGVWKVWRGYCRRVSRFAAGRRRSSWRRRSRHSGQATVRMVGRAFAAASLRAIAWMWDD